MSSIHAGLMRPLTAGLVLATVLWGLAGLLGASAVVVGLLALRAAWTGRASRWLTVRRARRAVATGAETTGAETTGAETRT
jgi:hypothetical protein